MGLFLNIRRTASQWGLGENTMAVKPFTKSTSKIHLWLTGKPGNVLDPVTWNDITWVKKRKKIQAHEVLQDTELWPQVNAKHLACRKNQVIANVSSWVFPYLIVALNTGYHLRGPARLIVALQNPEVSVFECSTPLTSSHCYTMHRNGQKDSGDGIEFTHRAYIQWTV